MTVTKKASAMAKRKVNFSCADIVEFEPTVWTASVTSGGIPIGMSTQERNRCRRRLDSYETERSTNRVSRQNYMEEGYLDPLEREEILEIAGHNFKCFDVAQREIFQIMEERRESNEIDVKFQFGLGEAYLIDDEDEDEEDEDEDMRSPQEDDALMFCSSDEEEEDHEVLCHQTSDCFDYEQFYALNDDAVSICTLGDEVYMNQRNEKPYSDLPCSAQNATDSASTGSHLSINEPATKVY